MPGEPRGMWCSNQTCEARIQARKWAIHQQRLREMRPSIDAKDPRRPKKHDGRKARLEEERNQQIMHENTILLNKLSKILTRESNGQDGKLPTLGPGGSAGGASASLHDIHRRKVREQIDRENRQLLTRLQTMKPSIDIIAFEEQYQQHLLHQQASKFVGNPMLQSDAAAGPPRRRRAPRRRPRTTEPGERRHLVPEEYLQPLDLAAQRPATRGGRMTAEPAGGSDEEGEYGGGGGSP